MPSTVSPKCLSHCWIPSISIPSTRFFISFMNLFPVQFRKTIFCLSMKLRSKLFVYWMCNEAGYVSIMTTFLDENATPRNPASRIKTTFSSISLRAVILRFGDALLSYSSVLGCLLYGMRLKLESTEKKPLYYLQFKCYMCTNVCICLLLLKLSS